MVYHSDLISSYDVLEVTVFLKNFYFDLDLCYLHENYYYLLTRVSSGRFYLKPNVLKQVGAHGPILMDLHQSLKFIQNEL